MNESLRTRSTAATVACQILAGQISGTGYGLLLYLLEVVFLYRDAHTFMGGSLTAILALYLFFGWVVGSVAGLAAGILLAGLERERPAGAYYGSGPVLGLFFTVVYLLRDVTLPQFRTLHPSIVISLAAAVFMWIGIGFLKGRFFAGLPVSPGARRMIRNTLALLAVFSVAGSAGLSYTEARRLPVRTAVPESSPNVVLVVVDGLRADHVSASGYKTSTTPNLDRLAREGTWFTNAYSHGSTSDVALPALFTSTYPSPGSITVQTDGVVAPAPWKTTMVDMFRNAGYTTVGIMGNVYVRGPFELTRRFDYVEEFDVFRFNLSVYRIFAAVKLIAIPGHAARGIPDTACVTDLGLRWLERLERRPFFLFLNCADVRFSRRPPANGVPDFAAADGVAGQAGQPVTPADRPRGPRPPLFSKAEIQKAIDLYDRCLVYTDAELGRLFDAVAGLPAERETIIIFTASYGTEFLEHGFLYNANHAVEELIRVPMLIWSSKGRSPGGIVDALVRHVDVLPTVADFIGAPEPETALGESLAPLARGASRRRNNYSVARGGFCTSMNFDGWKLMRVDSTGTYELYDLTSDPWGTVNVADSHAGQLGKLKLRMEEYFETVREVEDDETLPLSTEEGRRSRAPGHLR